MKQKQIISIRNMMKMLRPCTRTSYFGTNLYDVFELESVSGQPPVTYSFSFNGCIIRLYAPTKYILSKDICDSLATMKPIFEKLEFTPIAFVTTNVQGSLTPKAFVDLDTHEYDMRKHVEFDLRLSEPEVTQQSDTFTRMYKFVLRDKKTNMAIPMPYYIEVPGSGNRFDRIVTDKNIQTRFIKALQKMRSK